MGDKENTNDMPKWLLPGLRIGSLLLFLLSASRIYLLSRQEALWGYWPLWLFLSAWWTLVLFLYGRHFRAVIPRRRLLWSTLSGVLLGLAFPFSDLPSGVLALVAWVPFLALLARLKEEGSGWKTVFFYSYHTFFLWNTIATYWVTNSALPAGIFALVVNSGLMVLPVLLYFRSRDLMPRLGWLPLVAFWLCFEHLHHHWELNWPWLSLGNALATSPALVQWYAYTGILSGSLWLLISNILILRVWQEWNKRAGRRMRLTRAALWIGLPIAFSLYLYRQPLARVDTAQVVVVQPNVEPHYGRDRISDGDYRERLLRLADSAVSRETDFLAYPETTFSFQEREALNEAPEIQILRRRLLANYPDLTVIAGIDAYHILSPAEPDTRFTRSQEVSGGTRRFEVYNAAVEFTANSDSIAFYKKSKLVPGPELFPYPRLFFFLKPVLEAFGGTTAGRGFQRERSVFAQGRAPIAPAICYESVFGPHLAAHVRNGAQAIFILTNDAWWDHTAGHIQHWHYARLRAIENRRAIARAANTGISGFIGPKGEVWQKSRYNETVALRGDILLQQGLTFYSKNPGLVSRFALFAGLVFLLNLLVKGLLPQTGERN